MVDDPDRTKPTGMARYAKEFREAADAADKVLGHKPGFEIMAPIPVLYLIGHSMELSLKAYLLHQGVTLNELRKTYGHNLRKCMKKSKELGILSILKIDEHEESAFAVLDELYSTKQLEYIVTGAKTFPIYGYLHTLSTKLLEGVGPYVGYKH